MYNQSAVAGTETVFLFVQFPGSAVSNRAGASYKELKGFYRVSLTGMGTTGSAKRITIPLRVKDLNYWDTTQNAWLVEPGTVKVIVGAERQRGVDLVRERRRCWLRTLRHLHGDPITETGRMNERSLEDRIRYSKLTPILAGLVALAWMGTARASDADPFAGDSPQVNASGGGAAPAAVPSNSSVSPAPAASPVSSAAQRSLSRGCRTAAGLRLSGASHARPLRRSSLARPAGVAVAVHAPERCRHLGVRLD